MSSHVPGKMRPSRGSKRFDRKGLVRNPLKTYSERLAKIFADGRTFPPCRGKGAEAGPRIL
jgi:hypothetical protein